MQVRCGSGDENSGSDKTARNRPDQQPGVTESLKFENNSVEDENVNYEKGHLPHSHLFKHHQIKT
jgi:hypothetical protein